MKQYFLNKKIIIFFKEINDLLHKSAFRNGLSQSLYAPEQFLGNINEGTVIKIFQIGCNLSFKLKVFLFFLS
jgi:hypothetical protein